MIKEVISAFPNIRTVATTLRVARSASVNGWGALCYHDGEFFEVMPRDVEIFDRVGGGDSFASGFIYGLLSGKPAEWALACGGTRRARHVHPRRHDNGHAAGSAARDAGRERQNRKMRDDSSRSL